MTSKIFFIKIVQINKSSNKVDSESVFHNCSPQGPCFKENSNDLNENIINIFDELNNASTLKDDFRQPCNKIFIDNNSESIIDFNVDPQFNRLTWEINDSNNFDSVKQIDGENNKVILDSNKRNDNNDNNNSIEQNNDADIPLGNSGVKRINHCNNNLIDEPIENFICSDLDVIEKHEESLSDNIIVNNEFNCDVHIVENTDDSNGNSNDDSNENITLSNYFRPTNINQTFRIEATSNTSKNNNGNLDSKLNDVNYSILQLKDLIDQAHKYLYNFQNNVNVALNPGPTDFNRV